MFRAYLHPCLEVPSGVTGGGGGTGGQSAPQRLPTGKFLLTYREKVARKKLKRGNKRRKIENGRREKVPNWEEDLFFFFFFFFFFCFFFFFFFAFHFSKRLKFVLGVPKWKVSTGKKKHFTPGKNQEKMTLPPSEKFSCYAPGSSTLL